MTVGIEGPWIVTAGIETPVYFTLSSLTGTNRTMLRWACSRSVWMKTMPLSIKLGFMSPVRRHSASEGRHHAYGAAGLALAVVVASAIDNMRDGPFDAYDGMPGTDEFGSVEYAIAPPSDFF
jgi:hypothetical protein